MAEDKKAKKEEAVKLPFHDVSLVAKARKAEKYKEDRKIQRLQDAKDKKIKKQKDKEQKEHEEALERFFAAGGKVQYIKTGDGNSDQSTASSVWGRRKKKEPEVKKK